MAAPPPKLISRAVTIPPATLASLGTVPTSKKTHLQFCKRYLLEISNKASNELNLVGIIAINQKCPIVKPISFVSQALHHAGRNSYYSNIISVSKYYNFSCLGLKYLTNANIKHYVGLMQQKYILCWQYTKQNFI